MKVNEFLAMFLVKFSRVVFPCAREPPVGWLHHLFGSCPVT